jgi:general secretion pathway protein A
VDDPHRKRPPLVEDPRFLDSLNDLDRGLDDVAPDGAPSEPPLQPPATGVRTPRAVRIPAPPPVASATDPLGEPFVFTPKPPTDPPPRRPLLDLFPASLLESERPPGPLIGTAIGPQLPGGAAERVRLRAEPPPRQGQLTYETFYGLREAPFDQSTDPRFFFHGVAHERVASDLLDGIRERDGVSLLTGEQGAGKTTLCRAIVGELDRRTVPSIVLEPVADVTALLKIVLVDFGVMSRDELARAPHITRAELAGALDAFFASLAPLHANALIVLDEVHRQPAEVVSDLCAIARDGAGSGVLRVLLVGVPRYADEIKKARRVDAAISLRCELGPLAADEIRGYVMHRLAVAGTSPRVDFDEEALRRLYDLSRGVPGIVNILCDRALISAFQRSASVIDVALVDAASVSLDLALPIAERRSIARRARVAAGGVLLMLLGAASALWVFRDAVARTYALWQDVPPAPAPPILRKVSPLVPIPPPRE